MQRQREAARWPEEDESRKEPEEDLKPPDITSKVSGTHVKHKKIESPGGKTICLLCGSAWPCPGGVPGVIR